MSEDSAISDVWTVLVFLVLGIIVGLKWDVIHELLTKLLKMVTS